MDAGKLQFAKPAHREFAEKGAGVGLESRLAEFLKESLPTDKDIATIQAQLLKDGTDNELLMIVTALSSGSSILFPFRRRHLSVMLL